MVDDNVLSMIAMTYACLLVGTIIRWLAVRHADAETRRKRLGSLATWWVLLTLVAIAIVLGSPGVCLLLLVVTLIAISEYSRLVATRPADRPAVRLLYVTTVAYYGWIAWYCPQSPSPGFVIALLLAIGICQLVQGETRDYVRGTAGLFWGAMLLIFGLSHLALLTTLPDANHRVAGPAGWFLYVVVLTQSNDIAQALVGRRIGSHKRHRITPVVSPNKTWEGFLGGVLSTVLLSLALAPWLTSLNQFAVPLIGHVAGVNRFFWPVVCGVAISVLGLFGDINMSAVKRDVGVKDSSALLPGMGGILDRIDSLTFTAPAFYYFVMGMTS